MVQPMIGRLFAMALVALAATTMNARAQEGERAQMVVELFTSQGCSQCPRANRLLGMFAREDDVLPHVRQFAVAVRARGYASEASRRILVREDARGDHTERSWRLRVPRALRFFFSYEVA